MLISSRGPGLRRGLTLIELIIVLGVLAILAGIIVPKLVDYLEKGHGAAGVSNIAEIHKWVEAYRTTHGGFPNQLDSLVVSGGTYNPKLSPELTARLEATPSVYTAAELAALTDAGITTVYVPTGTETFASDLDPLTLTPLSTTLRAARIDKTSTPGVQTLQTELRQTPADITAHNYLVFGFGAQSTMIGKVVLEAPMDLSKDPSKTYSRFVLVFRQPTAGGTLRFVGALGFEGGGFNEHARTYFGAN